MSTNLEKKDEVQLEDASSGEVAAREEIPPPYDEMNLQAFLAIVVSNSSFLPNSRWLRRLGALISIHILYQHAADAFDLAELHRGRSSSRYELCLDHRFVECLRIGASHRGR